MATRVYPSTNSRMLRSLLEGRNGQQVTMGAILAGFKEQGYGILWVLFSLPVLIPLPPGLGAAIGILLVTWGIRRAMGLEEPWLPGFLGDRVLSARAVAFIRRRGLPLLEKLDPDSKPETSIPGEAVMRVVALVVSAMGLLIILPTPFLNTLPALAVTVLGIGVAKANRWILFSGISLGGVAVTLIAGAFFYGGEWLLGIF